MELIVHDDYMATRTGLQHTAKLVTLMTKGRMYVPTAHRQMCASTFDRIPESPGQNPCPELEEHGGIWTFDPNKTNQTIKDGKRYATGIRSAVAMTWNPIDKHFILFSMAATTCIEPGLPCIQDGKTRYCHPKNS